MTNKKISNFEFATLNYFLTRAFLLGVIFNTLIKIVKQDSWIMPLLGIIPAVIFIVIIDYISKYEPNLNLSEKIFKLFKKKIGSIIIIFISLVFLVIGIISCLNLTFFVQSQYLNKTPLFAITIMFALTSFFVLSKGLNVICRTCCILFYIGGFFYIGCVLGLIPVIDINNLKPFLQASATDYMNALNGYYTYSILPIFMLAIIPKNRIDNPKIKKTLIISYVASAITLFLIILQTLGIFGYELTILYEYPEFLALKHISLLGTASRVESILIIQLLFDIFIFNIFIIYFIGKNIKTLFNFKHINIIYFIVCVLLTILTIYMSKYSNYIYTLIKNDIPITLNIISILVILLICIKIKISKN